MRYDFQCQECNLVFEVECSWEESEQARDCKLCQLPTATRLPVATKSYGIKGDNSASTTPKRGSK